MIQRLVVCAFHFVEIFHLVEIRSVIFLYLLYLFIYLFKSLFTFGKFCSSDPSFNGNILTSLYLKFETTAHAQLFDYLFIHTVYKFHGMVLAGNSH